MQSLRYPNSGLTERNCEVMLEYLNAKCNPYPVPKHLMKKFDHGCITWTATTVAPYMQDMTKMRTGSHIVLMRGLGDYMLMTEAGLSEQELATRYHGFRKFLKDHPIIQGKFYLDGDSQRWFITDPAVLSKLKDEAYKYLNIESKNSKDSKPSVASTVYSKLFPSALPSSEPHKEEPKNLFSKCK